MKAVKTKRPTWNDVKGRLADFDRAGLVGLIHDLYAASKDNQAFLHARLSLRDDALTPYKSAIDPWLWPDVFKDQSTSVAKAKKAISDYKKAIGQPDEQALKAMGTLPEGDRLELVARLAAVRSISRNSVMTWMLFSPITVSMASCDE